MRLDLKWRGVLILISLVLAVVLVSPSLTDSLPGWWLNNIDKIHLGLDLKGGMHLILEVQTEKAVEGQLEQIASDLRARLVEEKVYYRRVERIEGSQLEIELLRPEQRDHLYDILDKYYPLREVGAEPSEKGLKLRFSLLESEVERIRKSAVDQALETIRNRVDQFGASEPEIVPQGENRILIQLPGIKDPQRAISLIGKTALLEFKLVEGEYGLREDLTGKVPPDSEVLYKVEKNPETGISRRTRQFVVKKNTLLTGDLLSDARVRFDQLNQPYIALTFNSKGAEIFERVTGENVGKRLAIVLDNNVYSAPVIRDRISGGRAVIEGRFSMEEAHDLAIILRAGSLPAPVVILEQRTVGPSLGADSVRAGMISMLIGGLSVIAFMIFYYRVSGIIANVALMMNIVLIMGALAGFKATLTLPGIAGIILTIGMAVDANVLIFERIREELRLGKTIRAAVEGGYSKAFLTIIDANLTTLIAALVLFQFGTGPIKGFAVTLSVGILASLFTAIFVTRTIFDYLLLKKKVKQIAI